MPRSTWTSLGAAASAISLLVAPMAVRADQPASTVHTVQAGETLSQIGLDAGIDTATLASLNGLGDANVLAVGQSLKLPGGAGRGSVASGGVGGVGVGSGGGVGVGGAAPSAPAAAQATYTVVDGDTLWDIAHRFGTTTDALVQLNRLDDADHLALGAVLTLPASAAGSPGPAAAAAPATGAQPSVSTAAPRSPAAPPPTSQRSLLVSYTVQPGENLTQIARQFDVSGGAIAQASALDDPNTLPIGSVLKVPVPAKEHVVAAGETLRDIAAAEKVDLGSLIDFNTQLDDPALIRVGQLVLLPIAANGQAAAAQSQAAVAPDAANPAPASPPAATPTPRPIAPAPQQAAAKPAAPDTGGQVQAGAKPTAAGTGGQAQAAAQATAPNAGGQQAAAKPAAQAPAAPKPAAPLAVVAPPRGAPSDGLAGAGLKLLGAPYVWGGSSLSGFDCSGLVWYVAGQLGKHLSRGMFGQYNSGSHPGRDELKPGDLVFFQNTFTPGLSHNGIYIGNRQFVHAADEAAGVTLSSLDTPYWSSHWFGATRLP